MRRSARHAGARRARHCCPASASMSHCRSRASRLARYEFTCLTSLLSHGLCVMDKGRDRPAGPGVHCCGQQIKGSQGCQAAVAGPGPGGRDGEARHERGHEPSMGRVTAGCARRGSSDRSSRRQCARAVATLTAGSVPGKTELLVSYIERRGVRRYSPLGDRRGLHLASGDCADAAARRGLPGRQRTAGRRRGSRQDRGETGHRGLGADPKNAERL